MDRLQPIGHFVLVHPCATDTYTRGSLTLAVPDDWIEAHVNAGRVVAVGPLVQESIHPGDVVAFLGWKAAIFPGYAPLHERLLRLHEDDIEAVIC